jgi:GT2 family glycosyltransferase
MKNINTIIVHFNQQKLLFNCLESIANAVIPADYQLKVTIIDNSNQLENEDVKSFPFEIDLQTCKRNIGFSKAVNLAIKTEKKADFYWLVNPDAEVDKHVLSKLMPIFQRTSKVGILSPVISFKRNGKFVYDLGGKINHLIGRAKHKEVNSLPSKKLIGAEFVSGCCMMVKREVFDQIGYFDEQFFLYFEDVDFCIRAKKAGFKIKVYTEPLIYHYLEEKKSECKKKYLLKSNFHFILKHQQVYTYPVSFLYLLYIFLKNG